jgi:hypothetical protein
MSKGNEPAYPEYFDNGGRGLTKRELIAAMAMQGMIAGGRYGEEEVSAISVAYADALLAQLSKEP